MLLNRSKMILYLLMKKNMNMMDQEIQEEMMAVKLPKKVSLISELNLMDEQEFEFRELLLVVV